MRQMIRVHVSLEGGQVQIDGFFIERRLPPGEVDASIAEQHLARTRDAAHAQIKIEPVLEAPMLFFDLPQQRAADGAGADQADRHRLRGQVEARVCGSQRPCCLVGVYDRRDVAL